ncbi:flagellar basal body rod protein FlgB [Petroclostridium sp. X23]|uniref:flagellar basal body rod protein FlgB n=1 Tax=Petroclostridium sp. X23 TaxID=3045146 RepID=UPI0024AD090D|nr:flagellar basal body rod protein FlgB [Petroclostridium sp. X23]WHH58927.1 flagellar basal body rod protein FlgB [Petroclostridium sp. X23]
MSIKLFNSTAVLEKALDASWLRNEAIADNLSNVDTPGYKRQKVDFENFLAEAIENRSFQGYKTHEKHIAIGRQPIQDVKIKMQQDSGVNEMRMDGNNVDIDAEMALLSKNNIYYNAAIQQLSKQFNGMKSAMRSGG